MTTNLTYRPARGCTCGKHLGESQQEESLALLEHVGLREVVEQAIVVPEVMLDLVRHAQKSERAERLELGADVVALHRQAAQREQAQAIRQLRAAIARLDDRVGRDDWDDLVARTRREFDERGGREMLDEARGRFRFAVLEADGLSGDDAGLMVARFDESMTVIQDEGLEGAARLLKESLDGGLEAIQAPEMGRQPASPQTGNRQFCINAVLASAAGMLLACFIAPFCWCCAAGAVVVWMMGALLGCGLLDE
jgi:hypothetical protein